MACCGGAHVQRPAPLVWCEMGNTTARSILSLPLLPGKSQPASTPESAGKTLLVPGLCVRSWPPGLPKVTWSPTWDQGLARRGRRGRAWSLLLVSLPPQAGTARPERTVLLRRWTLPVSLWTEQRWEASSTFTHSGPQHPSRPPRPPSLAPGPQVRGASTPGASRSCPY